eukprot:TRINITY_DN38328_c0_g1_i1.p1 TRINITY_DN38328_c0_g1~~TRINITY_DN38328_c0_g1_i1.p1  ORF type:complete len:319 (+),score=49.03 TRINITY_DN38328_c0_g1_i1:81-1037(+)
MPWPLESLPLFASDDGDDNDCNHSGTAAAVAIGSPDADGPGGAGIANRHRGFGSAVVAAVAGAARNVAGEAPPPCSFVEAVAGPHLRAAVLAVWSACWWWGRRWSWWTPQLTMLLFFAAATTASSAVWCTSEDLVLSLGPIPVCIFRRRFPYKDIASIAVVRGRWGTIGAMLQRGPPGWRFFSLAYGLTLGKPVVEVTLEPDCAGLRAMGRCAGPLLLSVDDAEDIVELVRFRKEHGPEASLPPSLAGLRLAAAEAASARWVWCDICDPFVRPWNSQDKVMCNMWDLLLQPWRGPAQPTWREHAAARERDHRAPERMV